MTPPQTSRHSPGQPPAGLDPYPPDGDALSAQPSRTRFLIGFLAAVLNLVVVAAVLVLLLTLLSQDGVSGWDVLVLAVVGVLLLAVAALNLRVAWLHRGVTLIIDHREVRQRDVFGWIRVPWTEIEQVDRVGQVVRLRTADGVRLDKRLLRRKALSIQGNSIGVDPVALEQYLAYRHKRNGRR